MRAPDAPERPDSPPGPLWTIERAGVARDGRRWVLVRIRGGRRFRLSGLDYTADPDTVASMIDRVVREWPAQPPSIIQE